MSAHTDFYPGTEQMPPRKRREWRAKERLAKGAKKQIGIMVNAYLYNRIIDVANNRRTTISNTVRQLIYMGLREWELNQQAGRIKKKDIEADYNKRKAEAQALAALKRQSRGKGQRTVPAVTPMLFGTIND